MWKSIWARTSARSTRSTAGAFAGPADIVKFYKAFDDWSFTLKIDRNDPEAMKGWNLAGWVDFREIMDRQMANAFAKAVDIGRQYDPEGRFGFTGTHHPGVFSGHNYAKLCPLVGIVVPYNIGNTPEIVRSLNPQTCYQVLPSWLSGDKGVRDIWTRALHGDRGMIFWDNDEPTNKFIQPAGQAAYRAGQDPRSGPGRTGERLGQAADRFHPRQQRHRHLLLPGVDPCGFLAAEPWQGTSLGRDAQRPGIPHG